MFLEVFPMLEEPEEEDGNDSVLHHHRLWHLFCVSDLRTKRIGKSYSIFFPNQVHESFIIPTGVDPLRWEDWLLSINEHLMKDTNSNTRRCQ